MNIPLVNLKVQYESIKEEIDQAIKSVIDNSSFIMGKHVQDFDNNFANFFNTKHGIGVANGTAALHLALYALDIKPGDEVITVSNTFTATAEAIVYQGAKPVFVDINENTYNIDTNKIEKKITNRTKAIIPVHLYGNPCDMDAIIHLAQKYDLKIIEDCAQSHGAEYKNQKTGTIGEIGCFSMFPAKILGAFGDAGGVITNNHFLGEKIKKLRDHGRTDKYQHEMIGFNYRLHALQAAILNVKLKYLNQWIEKRREIAHKFNEGLKNIVITPTEEKNSKHSYYLYVIRAKERDKLLEFLKTKNIYCGIHYPIPLHLQPAYSFLNHKKGDFPITEKVSDEILSLPLYPEMTDEEIDYIIKSIKEFYS